MPTQVMTPIAVQHVGSCRIEIGLEIKWFPWNHSITREPYLITMISQSSPAVVKHRTCLPTLLHIAEKCIVNPPGITQILHLWVEHSLLPVQPPEVHSVFFHRSQNILEHILHELLIWIYPRDRLLCSRVYTHVLSHLRIFLFISSHSVCRMQVECHFHVILFQVFQKTLRIWK